jgi:hypothetical protein
MFLLHEKAFVYRNALNITKRGQEPTKPDKHDGDGDYCQQHTLKLHVDLLERP